MLEEVEGVVDAAVVFAHLGAHEVDPVGGAASGESRVPGLLAEGVVGEDEGLIDGGALGFVDRRGVAVGEVPGVDVLGRDGLGLSVAEPHPDAAGLAWPFYRSELAVGEAEASVVSECHDLVADGVVGAVVGQDGGAEVSVVGQGLAGSLVEVGDGASSAVGALPRRISATAWRSTGSS